jgi:hypothetical protein
LTCIHGGLTLAFPKTQKDRDCPVRLMGSAIPAKGHDGRSEVTGTRVSYVEVNRVSARLAIIDESGDPEAPKPSLISVSLLRRGLGDRWNKVPPPRNLDRLSSQEMKETESLRIGIGSLPREMRLLMRVTSERNAGTSELSPERISQIILTLSPPRIERQPGVTGRSQPTNERSLPLIATLQTLIAYSRRESG